MGLILVLTFPVWLSLIGRYLVVSDPLAPTADAVVPLAGERTRVDDAADLFSAHPIRWFVITEMWVENPNPLVPYIASVTHQAVEAGVPLDRIVVAPGVSASTYEEAQNLRRLAEERRWQALLVITSAYHTRRARMILRDVFSGSGIEVAVRPVRDDWYRPDEWWRSREGWSTTASEYAKLVLYLGGYHQIRQQETKPIDR